MRLRPILLPLMCCLGWISVCTAQCMQPGWLGSLNGAVYALTTWDQDGPGPARTMLVAGGQFTMAGTTPANHVAIWDGDRWHALGSGVDNYVSALVVFRGELYVGGRFAAAGGEPASAIARWDGSSWHPVGTGMSSPWDTPGVYEMTVFNDRLIAGGIFEQSGGIETNCVARWDGTSWGALGSGATGWVSALAVYRGELFIGGDAGLFSRWDGQTWSPLALEPQDYVRALTVYNDRLIAGGRFASVGGVAANQVAAWDGVQWNSLGEGLRAGDELVRALTVYNGELFAGGDFGLRVARWDGAQWQGVGTGPGSTFLFPPQTLCAYEGELIVGSDTSYIHWLYGNNRIARWNGVSWVGVGIGDMAVFAVDTLDGEFVAGGRITSPSYLGRVVRRTRGGWIPVGSPFNYDVTGFGRFQGRLIATGIFTQAGGVGANRIAEWDGESWRPLGQGLSGSVAATAEYDGKLVVGGSFTTAGGLPANRIALWDGNEWSPMGAGFDLGEVSALAVYNGHLIAAWSYTAPGGVLVNRVVRWDGSAWVPVGEGMNDAVYELAVFNGQLIAGGRFATVDGRLANGIARWTGDRWDTLGEGLTLTNGGSGIVRSLDVHQDVLVATGHFQRAGSVPAARIAAWDGSEWRPMGEGLTAGDGFSLASIGALLAVGGTFSGAGDVNSPRVALWTSGEACPPPCDPDVTCDGIATGFDIEATEQAVNGDFSNFCQATADLNGDGAVNGFDIETEEQRVNGAPC